MRRFFTEPENVDKESNTLGIIEDAAHITRVLRMKPGDCITVFDGSGFEYTARISRILDGRICADIIDASFSELEPRVKVTLFQGIPKAGKLDTIVQKAVELGVFRIVPFAAERSVAKISNDKKGLQKIERLNKISREAAKQCGRGITPRVEQPVTVGEMAEMLGTLDMSIMLYEKLGHSGERSLRSILRRDAESIGIIIGPEGGFSDSEAALLLDKASVHAAGLGPRILRTETAGSAALAIVMYEKNEI